MTNNVFQSLATLPKLREAWKEFWKLSGKQKSSGVDGLTPANFNRRLEKNLQSLCDHLRGGYHFDLLVAHPVPKPDGKKDRIICVPTVRDRLVQRLIGAHISERAEWIGIINEARFGFIKSAYGKRRGAPAARDCAIAFRREHPWAYKSDISAFFDRIRRDLLFEKVVRSVRTPSLDRFLRGAIECEIDARDRVINRKVKKAGIEPGLGVRQGMPLSPFFANVLLKEFDRKFISRGFRLVRYADDFIVLADNKTQCYEIDAVAREVLGKLSLEISAITTSGGKTRICAPDEGVEFLGLSLEPSSSKGYELVITPPQLGSIKRSFGLLQDFDYLRKRNINIANLTRTVENKIAGYKSAYPSSVVANHDELSRLLDQMRRSVLTHIFTEIFGADALSGLTKMKKQFLCLEEI